MARHPFLNKIDPDVPIFNGTTHEADAQGPWFSTSQARKVFFPWRSIYWLRWLERMGYIDPPEYEISGARAYSLVDIERIARELAAQHEKQSGKARLSQNELRKVLLTVKAIAVNYGYEVSR